jgi:hypothetical protein
MMTKTMQRPLINKIGYLAIFIALISGFNNTAGAQDLLKLKSGKELKVNIVEEGTSIIKYREYEDPKGPVYSIGKDKVDSIKYKKGNKGEQEAKSNIQSKDTVKTDETSVKSNLPPQLTAKKRAVYLDGVAQSSRSVRLLMEDQPEALKYYESGKKMFTASNACPLIVMVISFTAAQSMKNMTEQSDKMRVGIPVLCVDGALIAAGIILASKGKVKLQKSVSLYNSSLNRPVQTSLNFGLQGSGIGVAMKF